MVVGDRDYKQIVRDAIDSIGEDVQLKFDTKDPNTIYLHEATKCLRRSFYDRTEPLKTIIHLIFTNGSKRFHFPE